MTPHTDKSPPLHAEADYYGLFLLELSDVIEDALRARWDPVGIDLLCEGRDRFLAEFRARWPDKPLREAENALEGDVCDGARLLNALSGAEDSASMSGYDHKGSEMLRKAIGIFVAELRRRNVDV